MKKAILFTVGQLVIDDQDPKTNDFDLINRTERKAEELEIKGKKEVVGIEVIEKTVFSERYVGVYFDGGQKYPYSATVIDAADSGNLKEIKNPRSPDEIELDAQFFVLVDTQTSRIYVSEQRRKNFLTLWLKNKLGKEIVIKPLIAEKDFVEKINEIKEISFSVEPNLFNSGGQTISAKLAEEIYGFDAAEATLKLVYRKKKITDKISEKIKWLMNSRSELKNMTIVGRTSERLESILNIEGIINKLALELVVDPETQRFGSENVFEVLIAKIEGRGQK